MEATAMIESLAKLRSQFESPPSSMEMVRRALHSEVKRIDSPDVSTIFNHDQRQVLVAQIDQLSAFMESEDGADCIELLVKSFTEFVAANSEEEQTGSKWRSSEPPSEPE